MKLSGPLAGVQATWRALRTPLRTRTSVLVPSLSPSTQDSGPTVDGRPLDVVCVSVCEYV